MMPSPHSSRPESSTHKSHSFRETQFGSIVQLRIHTSYIRSPAYESENPNFNLILNFNFVDGGWTTAQLIFRSKPEVDLQLGGRPQPCTVRAKSNEGFALGLAIIGTAALSKGVKMRDMRGDIKPHQRIRVEVRCSLARGGRNTLQSQT